MSNLEHSRNVPLASRTFRIAGKLYGGRRRFASGAAALLAVAVGYHIVFGHNGLTVYQQKRETASALNRQLQTLGQENGDLREHVNRLQVDPDAIEHQAREELHYTRPGEVIYTLPPEPTTPPR